MLRRQQIQIVRCDFLAHLCLLGHFQGDQVRSGHIQQHLLVIDFLRCVDSSVILLIVSQLDFGEFGLAALQPIDQIGDL